MLLGVVRRADLLLLALGYFLLLSLPDSYSQITRWPWNLLPQGCLLGAGLVALFAWRRLGQPFDALVGFTVVGLVASAWLSPDQGRSVWYLTMVGGYLAVIYAVAARLQPGENLLGLLGLGQGVLSLAGLWQYGRAVIVPAWQAGEPLFATNNTLPLGHHNFVSGYLALTLPVTLALALGERGPRRFLWAALLVPGLAELYTTQSRGGWAGVLVGCLIVLVAGVRLERRTLLGLGGGVALAACAAWSSISLNPKPQLLFAGRDLSAEQRLVYLQTGFALWRDHPLFGVGPGVTGFLFPRYRPVVDPWMSRTAQQLHNTPVHLLAETGLVGLAAYLGWLGAAAVFLVRLWPKQRPLVAALAGGLGGYAVASLTDFQLENPAISATLALMAAQLALGAGGVRPAPRGLRPVAIALGLAVAVHWGRIDWAWWESVVALREIDRTDTMLAHLRFAERLDPDQPYYPLQAAQVLLERARSHDEHSRAYDHWLAAAIREGDRAVALLPTDPLTLTNTGWLHYYGRDWVGAARLFERALREDPTTIATAQLGRGLALLALGRPADAEAHLLREIVYFPDQWADERWQSEPLRTLGRRIARRALRYYDGLLARFPRDPDLLYQEAMLHLWQGRPEVALARLAARPAVQPLGASQPVAIRLPARVPTDHFLGLEAQALVALGRRDRAEEVLDRLDDQAPTVAACLREQLADPNDQERTYLATGQDYFLLRRTDGQVPTYFEPRRARTWAAMDCIHFGGDGRNARLPLALGDPAQS